MAMLILAAMSFVRSDYPVPTGNWTEVCTNTLCSNECIGNKCAWQHTPREEVIKCKLRTSDDDHYTSESEKTGNFGICPYGEREGCHRTCNGMDYVSYTNRGLKSSRNYKIGRFIKVQTIDECKILCDASSACKSFEAKYKGESIRCLLRTAASYKNGIQRVPRVSTTLYEKCNICEQPSCRHHKLLNTINVFREFTASRGCEAKNQILKEGNPNNGKCFWKSKFLQLRPNVPDISNAYVTFEARERGVLENNDFIEVSIRACPSATSSGCSQFVRQVRLRNDLPPVPPDDANPRKYTSWSSKVMVSGEPIDDDAGVSPVIINKNPTILTESISRDFWWNNNAEYKYIQILVRMDGDTDNAKHQFDRLSVWGSCDNFEYPLGKCSQQCELAFLRGFNYFVRQRGYSNFDAWMEIRNLVDTFPIYANVDLTSSCVPGCTTTPAMLAYLNVGYNE